MKKETITSSCQQSNNHAPVAASLIPAVLGLLPVLILPALAEPTVAPPARSPISTSSTRVAARSAKSKPAGHESTGSCSDKKNPPEARKKSAGEQEAEAWRSHPPVFPAPRPLKLPSVESYKLDNGLSVQLAEDHRFPYLTAFIGFKEGSAQEPVTKTGLADLTADQLTEGTEKRTSKEIASQADFIGGSLHAVVDYDFTILRGSCLSSYTDRLFNLLQDVLLHPSFPEKELTLKKSNWIQELVMKRSQPHFLLEEQFRKVVFGSHPYSIVAPRPEMIKKLTRDDLVAFHKKMYIPDDAILLVIGDFDREKMKKLIARSYGAWHKQGLPQHQLPQMKVHRGQKIYLVDRPKSVQSSIKVGNLGIKKSDPDYFKILVMNQILGGGAHSRLFNNLREDKGYTYGAYSSLVPRINPGSFAASADVRTEVTGPSLKEFIYELNRIRDKAVSTEELDNAKNYLVGQFQLNLETQADLAGKLLEVSLYNLPEDYLETYTSKVMAVNVADVQAAARKIIHANDMVITVVGDAKKIKDELGPFGPIEIYDASGKLTSNKKERQRPSS